MTIDFAGYEFKPEVVGLDSPYVELENRVKCEKVDRGVQTTFDVGVRPSLDSRSRISTRCFWTKKQEGYYSRIKSGLSRAKAKGRTIHFLTLTSSGQMNMSDLNHRWEVLKQRTRREFGEFEYCKVMTNEGGGVIHLLYFARWLTDNRYDGIHAWFSVNWGDINRSPVVWNVAVKTAGGMAAYLVNQYIAKQEASWTRIAYSWHWVCRGFVGIFKSLIRVHGFKIGLRVWEVYLARDWISSTEGELTLNPKSSNP